MSLFVALTPGDLARRVSRSSRRVVYLAPGVARPVADEMLRAHMERQVTLTVVLDTHADVCRIGYGDIEGLAALIDAGVPVRKAPGLRIGVILVDDDGWVFAPTPQVVEELRASSEPNAFRLGAEQADALISAVVPDWGREPSQVEPPQPDHPPPDRTPGCETTQHSVPDEKQRNARPEIGRHLIEHSEVEQTKKGLQNRPPQKFDLARQVQVYQSILQFVELELVGCHIARRTVTLPPELLNVQGSKEVQARLKSQFRLIDGKTFDVSVEGTDAGAKKLSINDLQREVTELRKGYIKSLGKRFGSVLLKKNKDEFCSKVEGLRKQIDRFREASEAAFRLQFSTAKDSLLDTFLPAVLKNPPETLLRETYERHPSETTARAYVRALLEDAFPDPADFVQEMRLDVQFKDVTYETLKDPGFRSQFQKAWRSIDLKHLVEEDKAIKTASEPE